MSRTRMRELERLTHLIDRFAGRKVAVLADLVVDEFLYGDIERVSREAPVLVLRHRRTETVPGGGGNAVANLRALDARPLPVGVVGRDDSGRRLLARLREMKVDVAGIVRAPELETPTKHRVLAGGVHTRRQQVVRIDRGERRADLPKALRREIRAHLDRAAAEAEGLIVADYGYGCARPERLSPALWRSGKPVFVDSRSRILDYRGVTAATPNQEEVEGALAAGGPASTEELPAVGRELLRRTENDAVLMTRGAQGMCLFERGRRARAIPAFGADEVADVTGAGDTVIAVFALACLAGGTFHDAARLANYAAGLVVLKMGTATVSREELRRAVEEDLRGATLTP